MRIYNQSNQIQELFVVDREDASIKYSIYIMAGKVLDLDNNLVVINMNNLVKRGLIRQISSTNNLHASVPVVEDIPVIEDIPEEVSEGVVSLNIEESEITEESVEDVSVPEEETVESPDTYVCTICGKEFASSRSLSMHMKKSHESN